MGMILDAFAEKLLDKLLDVTVEKAVMILGVKGELQNLRDKMMMIECVLSDAERRRNEDSAINLWVARLKDFMYDADDIFDDCMIEDRNLLEENQEVGHSSSSRTVCFNFPFFSCVRSVPVHYKIATDVKSLNDRLNKIYKDMEPFNFLTAVPIVPTVSVGSQPSSPLPELDVVGRDIQDATQKIVEILVSKDEQNCSLYAIVGMGGIGKTTLAKNIFNNSKIKDSFTLMSWVCVSKFYSSETETELLKKVIRNVGGRYGESTSIEELQPILKDALCTKRFFLVLDDVWQANVWVRLLENPVKSGATNSRILITTRDEDVAKTMGAADIHTVDKLSVDSGWELLLKQVSINGNEAEMERLKDVGMKIVNKCDGLPLAIKSIAGVLRTKGRSKREWEMVFNSDAWMKKNGLPNDLNAALYLSYEELPSPIKQCFFHCSLFPHDYGLFRDDLVREWIAEGYIKAQGNSTLEDVAEEYHMELVRRSFLQPDPTIADQSHCVMHDMFRYLAQLLAGSETHIGDPLNVKVAGTTTMTKLRRLAISSIKETADLPQGIVQQNSLRTLILRRTPPSLQMNVIMKLKHLRLLVLNGEKIEHIPSNIGDLVHLRLLDLDHTGIQELPDSIGNLVNLQFLMLADCKSLHTLPKSITKLCKLRCLNLGATPLSHIPKGICKLENLNDLKGFVIGDDGDGDSRVQNGCDVEELRSLNNLRYLLICKLERASNCPSVLSNKQCLKELILNYTPHSNRASQQPYTEQEISSTQDGLDGLSPPSCLEKLAINCFFGSRYPKWMSSTSIHTSLPNLTYLFLINCMACPLLPLLGELPCLKYLKIIGANAVQSIGIEVFVNGKLITAFPELEYLFLSNMLNLEEWSLIEEGYNAKISGKLLHFPRLKEIGLKNCPKLKSLPRFLTKAISSNILIEGARSLEFIENFPVLTDWMALDGNHMLKKVSNLPRLRELRVKDCPMLMCVEKLNLLQSLRVDDWESRSLPEWLISFLKEQRQVLDDHQFKLYLYISEEALKGCRQGCALWSVLQHVPNLVAYADGEDQSMYLKYTKEPYSYETNLEVY